VLYEAIIIAVAAGWLGRGKISSLAKLDLHHIWLVFLAFGIELGMDWLWGREYQWVLTWRLQLQLFFYLLLFIFLWLNRRLPGIFLIGAGFLLNLLVITANGGAMPATATGLDGSMAAQLQNGDWLTYTLLTESSRLPWLGDVILQPWPKNKIISIGDILISLGIFWLVFRTMTGRSGSGRLTSVRGMKVS